MIAEIVVACVVSAGSSFQPPEGWTITSVAFQGARNVCTGNTCLAVNVYPIESNAVTLSRKAKVGEKITAPQGCGQLETTVQENPR